MPLQYGNFLIENAFLSFSVSKPCIILFIYKLHFTSMLIPKIAMLFVLSTQNVALFCK